MSSGQMRPTRPRWKLAAQGAIVESLSSNRCFSQCLQVRNFASTEIKCVAKVDHNTLINQAARAKLRSIGCIQKGRSRTWLNDNGWWVTVVEFQPSAWSKGTYLNVGACWLWYAKDHLSFDDGYRIESFKDAESIEDFEGVISEVAARAAEEVASYRRRFPNVKSVAEYLRRKSEGSMSIWAHYHAGIACRLAGWQSESELRFRTVLEIDERKIEWIDQAKLECRILLSLIGDESTFRSRVSELVSISRSNLKLPGLEGGVFAGSE